MPKYRFTMIVDVPAPMALRQLAWDHSSMSNEEKLDFFGPARKPKVDACLRELLEPESPLDLRIEIHDSFAEEVS